MLIQKLADSIKDKFKILSIVHVHSKHRQFLEKGINKEYNNWGYFRKPNLQKSNQFTYSQDTVTVKDNWRGVFIFEKSVDYQKALNSLCKFLQNNMDVSISSTEDDTDKIYNIERSVYAKENKNEFHVIDDFNIVYIDFSLSNEKAIFCDGCIEDICAC